MPGPNEAFTNGQGLGWEAWQRLLRVSLYINSADCNSISNPILQSSENLLSILKDVMHAGGRAI